MTIYLLCNDIILSIAYYPFIFDLADPAKTGNEIGRWSNTFNENKKMQNISSLIFLAN